MGISHSCTDCGDSRNGPAPWKPTTPSRRSRAPVSPPVSITGSHDFLKSNDESHIAASKLQARYRGFTTRRKIQIPSKSGEIYRCKDLLMIMQVSHPKGSDRMYIYKNDHPQVLAEVNGFLVCSSILQHMYLTLYFLLILYLSRDHTTERSL